MVAMATNMVRKNDTCQKIILYCFEKDIGTLIFFLKIWKAYIEWYTSELEMEYLKK